MEGYVELISTKVFIKKSFCIWFSIIQVQIHSLNHSSGPNFVLKLPKNSKSSFRKPESPAALFWLITHFCKLLLHTLCFAQFAVQHDTTYTHTWGAHTLLGPFIWIFIPSSVLVCVHLYCRPVCVHYKPGQTSA